MASNITLSAAVRQNLLALQNTASLTAITQNRLATGKKVNSALDNPTNFFTASGLSARASDLSNILDAMSNGIQTITTADNGLTAITNVVQQMQATVQQASQDSSFQTSNFTVDATAIGATPVKVLTFSGGNVTGSVNVALQNFSNAKLTAASTLNNGAGGVIDASAGDITFKINGTLVTLSHSFAGTGGSGKYSLAQLETAINGTASIAVNATDDGAGHLILTSTGTAGAADAVTVSNFSAGDSSQLGFTPGAASVTVNGTNDGAKTVDQIVTAINGNVNLTGKVKASNDNGELRITNQSTSALTVVGADASNVVNGGTGGTNTQTIAGNTVRSNLVTQFNNLISQLNSISGDSSFNGINLLNGDVLKLVFNETNTSSISIQSQNTNGVNASTLGISAATGTEFSSNTSLSTRLTTLQTALTSLRSQSSAFGSNLSIVQNRTDFTKSMINTLQTGSDNLVLADTNQEGANMLALQTRQQLSITALGLSAQADQGILKIL